MDVFDPNADARKSKGFGQIETGCSVSAVEVVPSALKLGVCWTTDRSLAVRLTTGLDGLGPTLVSHKMMRGKWSTLTVPASSTSANFAGDQGGLQYLRHPETSQATPRRRYLGH